MFMLSANPAATLIMEARQSGLERSFFDVVNTSGVFTHCKQSDNQKIEFNRMDKLNGQLDGHHTGEGEIGWKTDQAKTANSI